MCKSARRASLHRASLLCIEDDPGVMIDDQRLGRSLGSSPLCGLRASFAGGAVSGFTDILGSTFGGGTAERESGIADGRRSIPGSIFDGGMAGAPDCDGFSGAVAGGGPVPFSGGGTGGITSPAKPIDDSNSTNNRPAMSRANIHRV